MPMMMMMGAMNGGGASSSKTNRYDKQESEMARKLKEMQARNEKLIEDLVKAKNETEYTSSLKNPVLQRLEAMDRKMELLRKQKLEQKEKGGMPKFLMYMQQNLMNQAMLQAHLNEPDPSLDQYPKIIPVAVDPRKRIMPFSTNPFINFEMNKPASKNKDVVSADSLTCIGTRLRDGQQPPDAKTRNAKRSRSVREGRLFKERRRQ